MIDGTNGFIHPNTNKAGRTINKFEDIMIEDIKNVPILGEYFSKMMTWTRPLNLFDNAAAGIYGFFSNFK